MQNSIAFMREKLFSDSFGHWLHGYDGKLQKLFEQNSPFTERKQKYPFSERNLEKESQKSWNAERYS